MTLTEIITTCSAIAEANGVQLVDNSDSDTLRLDYYKGGKRIGGASFIGSSAHPEYFNASDLKSVKEQITYLSRKSASFTY